MKIFSLTFLKNKQKKGFTLVETLVAILILTFAIIPVMYIASQGATSATQSRNQIIAAYLAQDAMDFILAVKNENIMACKKVKNTCTSSNGTVSKDWLANLRTNCTNSKTCDIITDRISGVYTVACTSSTTCPKLYYNNATGYYTHTSSPPNTVSTDFVRSVTMTKINNVPGGDAMSVGLV